MFKPASKRQSKLRLAFFGVAGAGKTYTSLKIATGINSILNSKIALIDSERGRAEKYADLFKFDICTLEKKTIDDYEKAILEAAKNQYDILIIDSLTHAWQELLVEVDNIARAKFGGNSWSAWSKGTPKQQRFINIILEYPGHIIATMRSKSEWVVETNDKGKSVPKRVGTTPEQGKGIEYEFDIIGNITDEHFLVIQKDITGKFQDLSIEKPNEDFGIEIINWLSSGSPLIQPAILLENYLEKNKKEEMSNNKPVQPKQNQSHEKNIQQIREILKSIVFKQKDPQFIEGRQIKGFPEPTFIEFCVEKKMLRAGQKLEDLSDINIKHIIEGKDKLVGVLQKYIDSLEEVSK